MSKQTVEDLLEQISRVSEQIGQLQYERQWLYSVIAELGGDAHEVAERWKRELAQREAEALERAAEAQGGLW